MVVYNINLGIGWASSGVEYAQAYRAQIFAKLGIKAKFIFMDYISNENIANLAANIDFQSEDIIWLYNFFSDLPLTTSSVTIAKFKQLLGQKPLTEEFQMGKLYLKLNEKQELRINFVRGTVNIINYVDYITAGRLSKRVYYTNQLSHEEIYENEELAIRRFYNKDGSVALEEFLTVGKPVLYKTKEHIYYSKEELIIAFMKKLNLTAKDIVLLDRETGIGQAIFENVGAAKLGVVIHAEHFSENSSNDNYILWNNFYDYQFTNADKVDFYITATSAQQKILKEQLMHYNQVNAKVYAIPVGSLKKLKLASNNRKLGGLITASRLASEKHIDWIVEAVVAAKKKVPELSLDIYGEGGMKSKLNQMITAMHAENYISLKGHQNLDEVYVKYEAYISASTSEGFGLTLLEALGSGLPIIGLDVRYGNQTFIDDNQNGYLLTLNSYRDKEVVIAALSEAIVNLFAKADLISFSKHSYEKAKQYLDSEIVSKWRQLVLAEVGDKND